MNPGLLSSTLLQKPAELEELEKEKLQVELARPESSPDVLAQAVLAQSQALTSLVGQIAMNHSDPLVELGVGVGGTRGSSGRAKLQQELASQKGLFFSSVLRSMSRRMAPTMPPEGTPMELFEKGISGTRYLERFGGYAKQRDLGAVQYQIMTALDYLQTENWEGARDKVALLAVMVEQAVLDGGRFELAQLLVLQDDLPSNIFINRQAGALARSKSFSPLADQLWITTALAYLKEMDTIVGKRAELANPSRGSNDQSQNHPAAKTKPAPKKKGGGKGRGGQKQEEEEDQ